MDTRGMERFGEVSPASSSSSGRLILRRSPTNFRKQLRVTATGSSEAEPTKECEELHDKVVLLTLPAAEFQVPPTLPSNNT